MNIDLVPLGWGEHFAAAYRRHDRQGRRPGRVLRVDQGVCTVTTRSGTTRASLGGGLLSAGARSLLALPCAGDWVVLRNWGDGPVTVEHVLVRRSAWVWPGEERAVAANLDAVLVADPDGWHPPEIPVLAAAPEHIPAGYTLGLSGVPSSTFVDLPMLASDGLVPVPGGGAVLEIPGGFGGSELPRQGGRRKMSYAADTVAERRVSPPK